MVTRRCTQRQFLLRPDNETNNAFAYCLAEAARRTGVEVILPLVMSNHHHTTIFDRLGTVIEFVEHLHKLVARSQNALRGRWENFWSSEQVSIVQLTDFEAVMNSLVYVATNPVKDLLVARVHHWPGFNGISALLNGRTITARRPAHFFRKNGPMPATATLELRIPPELGDSATVLATLRDRIEQVEREHADARKPTGRGVLGRRGVLKQSWSASPSSREPRRMLTPRVAGSNKWTRIEALQRNKSFLVAYRYARAAWLAGHRVTFPAGTYWLRRFAGVAVEEASAFAMQVPMCRTDHYSANAPPYC